MLKVDVIDAGYGKLHILEGVSIEAGPGEVTVIVGPNGSGKSTLLKSIAGLTSIYRGSISVDGVTLSGLPAHQIARKGVAYLPQVESVFAQLTVEENFKMAGYTVRKHDYQANLATALEMFPQLSSYRSNKVANLSGGERQMVAFVMALIRKPKLIMFDEPTSNLSPKLATLVLSQIRLIANDLNIIVLLVEQNARKALEIGDRAYLLVSGKNAFSGKAGELLTHKELAKLYLGLKVA